MGKKSNVVVANAAATAMALIGPNDKPEVLPIGDIIIDHVFNVRDEEEYTPEALQALMDDLATRGQMTPAVVEKMANGKYRIIQGHRRATVITMAAKAGVTNPTTGQPFDSIIAYVKDKLTEDQRIKLLLDEGQRKGLKRPELQRAFERGFDAQWTEEQVVVYLNSQIDQLYPLKRPLDASEDDYKKKLLAYRKGVLQTAKKIWQAPVVLHDAMMANLSGKQTWPKKSELFELVGIYEKERDADKTGSINRKNPGPQFMEKWNKLVKAQEEAAALGQTRAKNTSMMNHQQVTDSANQSNSYAVKIVLKAVKRDLTVDGFLAVDKYLAEYEEAHQDFVSGLKDVVAQFLSLDEAASAEAEKSEEQAQA